jgi:hypothetical protein
MARVRPYRRSNSKKPLNVNDEQIVSAIVQAYNQIEQQKSQKKSMKN